MSRERRDVVKHDFTRFCYIISQNWTVIYCPVLAPSRTWWGFSVKHFIIVIWFKTVWQFRLQLIRRQNPAMSEMNTVWRRHFLFLQLPDQYTNKYSMFVVKFVNLFLLSTCVSSYKTQLVFNTTWKTSVWAESTFNLRTELFPCSILSWNLQFEKSHIVSQRTVCREHLFR